MKDIIKHILVALLCIAASACADKTEDPQVAELPISVSVSLPQTKASIFDTQASLINSEIGGGNMIVSAYVTDGEDKGARHIDNVRVTYFADAKDWRFTNAAGAYVNYYWPKQDKLDFFAYFPVDLTKTGVTSVAYTYPDGPSFNYSLPLDSQDGIQEFIYSYATNQDGSTPNVQLDFHHPFAAVKFELGTSYRLEKMHCIKLEKIYYTGSYSTDDEGKWQMNLGNTTGTLNISIEKGVPDPINFNSPIGGPYLIAPQIIPDDAEFVIEFTRLDGIRDSKKIKLKTLGGIAEWEAGKLYTYNISLGNTEEEILFKVTVENWKVVDHKNEIDVE